MTGMRIPELLFFAGVCTVAGCFSPGAPRGHDETLSPVQSAVLTPPAPTVLANPANAVQLPSVPPSRPDEKPLPINLPTALQLAHVQAVDIAAATARIQVAAAQLDLARAQWLPTVSMGGDYFTHSGAVQDVSNAAYRDTHSSLMLGAGVGIGPAAVFTLTDAIFAPLAARQQVKVSQANRQAAANDTLVAVTDAYFTVQQARGELAGAIEAARLNENLVAKTRKLAPAIVPELELFRAETELARRKGAEFLAREHWKVASAELLRVLRLDATAQVEPLEPPQLRIDLVDIRKKLDELVPVALTNRPELASQQAQVQQTIELLKQERWRPLLPSVVLRGASTPGGTLAAGAYVPYPYSNVSGFRGDIDLQLLWQLNGLGFGNAALVNQRQAENRAAVVELLRVQDRVVAEVAQAHAQAEQAVRRVEVAEQGLKSALISVEKNLVALSQTKGIGNQQVTLVRPQEVVAAIQALAQSYGDYYGAIADANRAQFRLYRALGQPSQHLLRDDLLPRMCSPAMDSPALSATKAQEATPRPEENPNAPRTEAGFVPPARPVFGRAVVAGTRDEPQ